MLLIWGLGGHPALRVLVASTTPNLPTNITPTKIAWLKLSGEFPMGLGIPPLMIKIMLESNPLKSMMLGRLGGTACGRGQDRLEPLCRSGAASAALIYIYIYSFIYVCIYIYIYMIIICISISLSLSLSLYTYIYIYTYVYVCIYIYTDNKI